VGSSHLIDSITQHQAFGGLQTEATRSIERRLTFTTVVCIASDEHAFVAQTDDNNTENRSLQHSFNSYIQRTTKTTPAKPFPPPPPLLLLLILLLAVPLLLGMLNDYRIFDYRIKCSFSFSFVTHSILGIS